MRIISAIPRASFLSVLTGRVDITKPKASTRPQPGKIDEK
jgi:hypothetical protein